MLSFAANGNNHQPSAQRKCKRFALMLERARRNVRRERAEMDKKQTKIFYKQIVERCSLHQKVPILRHHFHFVCFGCRRRCCCRCWWWTEMDRTYLERKQNKRIKNTNIFCSEFIFYEQMSECAAKTFQMVIYLDTCLEKSVYARDCCVCCPRCRCCHRPLPENR